MLLTHMTPTGRAAGESLYGNRVLRAYLPYDTPAATARFLQHFSPQIGLLMETEIWPNLIRACRERQIPLLLINARLSERSARRYARVRGFAREVLNELSGIAAQTEADANRFTAIGANEVAVIGNLKFDIDPPFQQVALGEALRSAVGGRPVMLAASTREDEEHLVLDALALAAVPRILMIFVPRHPQRFDEVARLFDARGLRWQRRSELGPTPRAGAVAEQTQILLGDSLGEMFAYYRSADLAFVGGSLVNWGGHNLIEACAVGTPVLVGPYTMNFAEATELAIADGAARRVSNSVQLGTAIRELLDDTAQRDAMRIAAKTYASRYRGATARTLEIICRAWR
jgi:3-deoxy-D-manno-octulosonic-acid transferase